VGVRHDPLRPASGRRADTGLRGRSAKTVTLDFAGRTAVVRGVAQGIGLALAEMFSKAGARVAVAAMPPDKLEQVEASIPMGPIASADEICSSVGFLGPEEAGYITGVVLPVDGGLAI
jgi:3-oxoacyl-[acyl-carrier protein] reductase